MKIRMGFVSNSSSSSFVINKKDLTSLQIEQIKHHSELGMRMDIPYATSDAWSINESDETIIGSTWMNNFSMTEFLRNIKVPANVINWSDGCMDLNGILECCDNDLIENITNNITNYLKSTKDWNEEENRKIVKKEIQYE